MCNDCSIKPGRLALESGRTSPRPVPLSAPRPFLSRPRVEGSTDSELEPPQPVDNASEGLSDPKMPVLRLRGEEIEVSERALGYEMVRLSTTPRFDPEIRQGLASRHLPRSRWHGRGRRRPSGALVSEPAREMPADWHVHYADSRASVPPATCPASLRFTDTRDLWRTDPSSTRIWRCTSRVPTDRARRSRRACSMSSGCGACKPAWRSPARASCLS
jgi:hypothetical protein